jgi:regulator of sirC expression with transglutaminase-like and TPR domain
MDLDETLQSLARDPRQPLDLAEVALRLACDEYVDLNVDAYLRQLDQLAGVVRDALRGNFAARVATLCGYLFREQGFRGDVENYYDPRNSYLNEVLDRRLGLPITLSLLAMAVGRRAGLEVEGVGLPGHFIARAISGDEEMLFDPFHGGRQLSLDQCADLVRQVTGESFAVSTESMQATPPGLIVQRLLNNLKGTYLRQHDFARASRVMARLLQLAPDDALQHRDQGVSLLRAGQPGPAINHLEFYLEKMPDPEDAPTVRQYLQDARREVARWN